MRVLVMAPFERGRSQGGSQRSTAIAERLEERGIAVEWQTVARRDSGRASKLRSLARGEPSLTGLYQRPTRRRTADLDAMIIAHSYLVPAIAEATTVPRIVDFHNLEFRHLADGRRPGAGVLRRAYDRRQVQLMRRLERELVRTSDLSLLVSDDEHGWARAAAPAVRTLLIRSVLPRSQERAAAAIAAARREPRSGELAYVGRLTFPTNLRSLERFLSAHWPAMRAAAPGLRLTVAGACDDAGRARLDRHPGVATLGFVGDLTTLLASCQAVVMPFEGVAGTSLRALFYALAGLPVIGSPQAFRGIPFQTGIVAGSSKDWVAAARRLADGTGPDPAAANAARRRAQALQSDPAPWDRLAEAIDAMSDRAARQTAAVSAGARA
ncbi:MAG TPA: glycosyltransferase family 4 protein [Solirubrobacteraceae bacterium]|jgi:hypothetical protein|nr:glycosyltransferase family 4 protein [Solirubrobacteraceae bacterium]